MTRSANERWSSDAGTTLLELLITLALLSLLSLALFDSIRFGNRLWQGVNTTTAANAAVREAQLRLSKLIQAAYPKFSNQNPSHPTLMFEGEPSKLRFLAPDEDIRGALSETLVEASPGPSGVSLYYTQQLELRSASAGPPREHLLSSGLSTLRIDYFGIPTRGAHARWYSSWTGATRPPALVRIRAQFEDARLTWPELVLSPRIAGDISCRFEPTTRFCQGR